jgi:hypothetical protein
MLRMSALGFVYNNCMTTMNKLKRMMNKEWFRRKMQSVKTSSPV